MPEKERLLRAVLWGGIAAAVLLCAFFLLRPESGAGERWAVITCDGETVREICLDSAQDEDFSILDRTGKAVSFRIQNHRIRFLSSDCPDQICVNAGFQREENAVACCMPNRVLLSIELRTAG